MHTSARSPVPHPAVLRWADGRLRVEVRDSAPPGAPLPPAGTHHSVQVFLEHAVHPPVVAHWSFGCRAGLVELAGLFFEAAPGPDRPHPLVRGEGVATLVVNTGIQYLRTLYPGPEAPLTTEVRGKTGLPLASPDPAAEQRDVDGRARFWLRFGFEVGREVPGRPDTAGPHTPQEDMHAPLWRLTAQPGGWLFRRDSARGSRPLWVPLSAFARVDPGVTSRA